MANYSDCGRTVKPSPLTWPAQAPGWLGTSAPMRIQISEVFIAVRKRTGTYDAGKQASTVCGGESASQSNRLHRCRAGRRTQALNSVNGSTTRARGTSQSMAHFLSETRLLARWDAGRDARERVQVHSQA